MGNLAPWEEECELSCEVFISYSNRDKKVADAICARLESSAGIRCWIAPRDVPPGSTWAGAIVTALKDCKAIVVVLSTSSNQSPQVLREVERAVNNGMLVVPLRIEDIVPSDDLEYFLSATHWLDALTPPLERHLDKLEATLSQFLGKGESRSVDKPPVQDADPGDDALPPHGESSTGNAIDDWAQSGGKKRRGFRSWLK